MQLQPELAEAPAIEDQYLRGHDLCVRYAPTSSLSVRLQVDWRVQPDHASSPHPNNADPVETPSSFCLDGLFSVQTDKLDAHPTLRLRSSLGTFHPEADFGLPNVRQFVGQGWRYCEMVHPSDYQPSGPGALGSDQAPTELEHVLFGGFMEKGVIRRARVRYLIRKAELPWEVEELYHEFVSAPLPLTT